MTRRHGGPKPQAVKCDLCGAEPGETCMDPKGRRCATHAARWKVLVGVLEEQVRALHAELPRRARGEP